MRLSWAVWLKDWASGGVYKSWNLLSCSMKSGHSKLPWRLCATFHSKPILVLLSFGTEFSMRMVTGTHFGGCLSACAFTQSVLFESGDCPNESLTCFLRAKIHFYIGVWLVFFLNIHSFCQHFIQEGRVLDCKLAQNLRWEWTKALDFRYNFELFWTSGVKQTLNSHEMPLKTPPKS